MSFPELKTFTNESIDFSKIFDTALSSGGDLAELFFEKSHRFRMNYESGKVEDVNSVTDSGVSLRLLSVPQVFSGYTTEIAEEKLLEIAQNLSQSMSVKKEAKKFDGLFHWQKSESKKAVIRESLLSKKIDEMIPYAKRVDQKVRELLPEVKQVRVDLGASLRDTMVLTSEGRASLDQKYIFLFFLEIVAEKDGKTEVAFIPGPSGEVGLEEFEKTSPEMLAEKGVKLVQTLLSARAAPKGKCAVVMSADAGGTMIHEAVGHGLEADLACNHMSVYDGKIGKKVASELVTVVDDGTMESYRGSFRFDDEGNAAKKNILIENGILKSYMVDRISALKFDLSETGNGRRQTFRHLPMVRMTNTYIASGNDDPEQIIRDTKKGIFVKKMGGGSVNTVTGDFVFYVSEGYLIQDGKITDPIRGATLVGNGPEIMKKIDRVGNDLGFQPGTCGKDGQHAPVTSGQPTMRISEMTIGGEVSMEDVFGS